MEHKAKDYTPMSPKTRPEDSDAIEKKPSDFGATDYYSTKDDLPVATPDTSGAADPD